MKFRMEFHAAEGGKDAEAFAAELAGSAAKHARATVTGHGRVVAFTTGRL